MFRAVDTDSNTEVAIKYIQILEGHCGLIRSVSREIQILYKLAQMKYNTHTVKLLDCFFANDADLEDHSTIRSIYIVMSYYPYTLEALLYDQPKTF